MLVCQSCRSSRIQLFFAINSFSLVAVRCRRADALKATGPCSHSRSMPTMTSSTWTTSPGDKLHTTRAVHAIFLAPSLSQAEEQNPQESFRPKFLSGTGNSKSGCHCPHSKKLAARHRWFTSRTDFLRLVAATTTSTASSGHPKLNSWSFRQAKDTLTLDLRRTLILSCFFCVWDSQEDFSMKFAVHNWLQRHNLPAPSPCFHKYEAFFVSFRESHKQRERRSVWDAEKTWKNNNYDES